MSAPRSKHSRAARGFSLVEVMITLVILAFGMLTLAVMQLQALRQGSQGRHTGDATAIARSYLEQAMRLPWSVLGTAEAAGTWVAPGVDWPGQPATQVTVDRPDSLAATTEQAYTIMWRVTDVGPAPVCLRDIEVSVTWTEEGSATPKTHVLGTRRFNQGDSSC